MATLFKNNMESFNDDFYFNSVLARTSSGDRITVADVMSRTAIRSKGSDGRYSLYVEKNGNRFEVAELYDSDYALQHRIQRRFEGMASSPAGLGRLFYLSQSGHLSTVVSKYKELYHA